MRRALLSLLCLLAAASPALADEPATSFHVVKKVDLTKLLSKDKALSDLTTSEVEEASVIHGRFAGPCNTYFKNKDYQFRLKVKNTKKPREIFFEWSQYSREEHQSIGGLGRVTVGDAFTTTKDWNSPLSENMYAVLFRKVNLKE